MCALIWGKTDELFPFFAFGSWPRAHVSRFLAESPRAALHARRPRFAKSASGEWTSHGQGTVPEVICDRGRDNLVVVELRGDHDLATSAAGLREVLLEAISERRAVVVELSLASFIDSSILGAIIGGLRRARERDLGFALVVGSSRDGPARQASSSTRLVVVFPNYTSPEDAIAAALAGVNTPVLTTADRAPRVPDGVAATIPIGDPCIEIFPPSELAGNADGRSIGCPVGGSSPERR